MRPPLYVCLRLDYFLAAFLTAFLTAFLAAFLAGFFAAAFLVAIGLFSLGLDYDSAIATLQLTKV